MKDENKYSDILDMPHHVSGKHPPLGRDSLAAQFSPFAALSGYDEIVSETYRETAERPELDEDEKLRLSDRLSLVLEHLNERPVISVKYFVKDRKKDGGKFVTCEGVVKRFDGYDGTIYMENGTRIRACDVYGIKGEIISAYFEDE